MGKMCKQAVLITATDKAAAEPGNISGESDEKKHIQSKFAGSKIPEESQE